MERKERKPRTTVVTPVRFFYFHGLYLCANDLCKCGKQSLEFEMEFCDCWKKKVVYWDKNEKLIFIPNTDAWHLVECMRNIKLRRLGARLNSGEGVDKSIINIQQTYYVETFSEDEKQEEQFY